MNILAQETGIINPLDFKYHVNKGRLRTTVKILGQQRERSHLAYAYNYRIPFKTFLEIIALEYVIHHKNENTQEDEKHNLRLWPRGYHDSLHNSGSKNPFWGKHHTKESRQKISQTRIGNLNLKNEDIVNLVVSQGLSTRQAGKVLGASKMTIWNRLKHLEYNNVGPRKKPIWIKGGT